MLSIYRCNFENIYGVILMVKNFDTDNVWTSHFTSALAAFVPVVEDLISFDYITLTIHTPSPLCIYKNQAEKYTYLACNNYIEINKQPNW